MRKFGIADGHNWGYIPFGDGKVIKTLTKLFILTIMLLGLPLSGIFLANKEISPYLEFPPHTSSVRHAPFSWPAFGACALFILAVVSPFVIRAMGGEGRGRPHPRKNFPFPWWGWFGILLGALAWVLAWSRFYWFAPLQPHTFTPFWVAYILAINALTHRRTGHCLLCDRTLSFFLLFPVSAAFWWFFEYLNRFVQNWYYVGAEFGAWEYFWYATLPFSTVLPAVISTREWLLGFRWPEKKFGHFLPIRFSWTKGLPWIVLLTTGIALATIGLWPNYLFPFLWISPLLIIVSLQSIFKENHLFSALTYGDWRNILCSALAALICGFFWEMWNYYSLAKWRYNIPFVHRFQLFEMPILGFAGYLPFGLQCAAIAEMVMIRVNRAGGISPVPP